MPTALHTPTHYSILSLPSPTSPSSPSLTSKQVKQAYRDALLLHHPDKSLRPSSSLTTLPTPNPTIDQITLAYKTLISPSSRSAYDRSLLLTSVLPHPHHPLRPQDEQESKWTGQDTVLDLDDFHHSPVERVYYTACRCGSREGREYVVTESELEKAVDEGEEEVGVQCAGCSLWVWVAFSVVEEEQQGEEGKDREGGESGVDGR
ncbi:uncharacterized protein KY384_009176 [Bacidia gigantensis]|uniref:uncharacterized protein n=1 Tax=Bacidia gigantensis TaxID=2732470 RepID=UPI001D05792C|nr:uncharacterized protein KY384_009176 [Bacidia gigantensis]KAG8525532.1 hypothetical protein KY384_009176 [Bacidia gigantensis]